MKKILLIFKKLNIGKKIENLFQIKKNILSC